MDEIYAHDSKRNSQPQNSGGAARDNGERVRCRNLALPHRAGEPDRQSPQAFCSKYCPSNSTNGDAWSAKNELPRKAGGASADQCRKCRLDSRNFRPTFLLSDSSGYPGGQNVNLDSKSPIAKRALFCASERVRRGVGRTLANEHRLFRPMADVATISGVEGDWRVTYPLTIPVQTATTLEAARKLAINVAFWTWPIGGIKPKPASQEKPTEAEWRKRDAADEQYVAADEERLLTEPVDLSGNYAPPDSGECIDWPFDEGAP